MRIAIMLAVLAFIVIPSVEAAPINNSTELVPEVHTVTEVVQETPPSVETIQSEAPTPEPQKPVEPERPPEPVKETVAVVKHPAGCENYRNLISQYEWNVDVALKVMQAESGCNPHAVGDKRVIGGIYAPSCGLFQIRTLSGRPSCDQLQNPNTNVEWAIKLYRASGWQPWSVCRTKVSCY